MVILFGTINILFIRYQVYKTYEQQANNQGLSICKFVAEQVTGPLLFNEISDVNQILHNFQTNFPEIDYMMVILPNGQVVAHTLSNYPPKQLLHINQPMDSSEVNILVTQNKAISSKVVRDFAAPILNSKLGTLRLGLSEVSIQQNLQQTTRMFFILILLLLFFGIGASFILSYIISAPVRKISLQASMVNLNTLKTTGNELNSKHDSPLVGLKNLFNLHDEIDTLENAFREMLSRLNSAYAEIEQTRDSLSQTEKMASVGTMAAGLAHEINNPLTGIKNCLRRIAEHPENLDQNKTYLEMMSEAVDKIGGVVEGMLNFSRKQEFKFVNINLAKHIDNAVELVNFQLVQSNIQLSKRFENQKIEIYASPNHLEQVFVNILLNSIDAINEKRMQTSDLKGHIDIETWTDGAIVGIAFTDNGTGVPQENVSQIFEPFITMKKIKQGTGLGLAVTSSIINRHNGHITGTNMAEGGFKILITIPQKVNQ